MRKKVEELKIKKLFFRKSVGADIASVRLEDSHADDVDIIDSVKQLQSAERI